MLSYIHAVDGENKYDQIFVVSDAFCHHQHHVCIPRSVIAFMGCDNITSCDVIGLEPYTHSWPFSM